MAVCVVADNPKGNAETYEQVVQRIAQSGGFPPSGAVFQVAGPTESGWRVITVWNSREDFDRFAEERLRPAWGEAGVSPDDVSLSIFEAHSFMAGDVSGAARPG